MKGILLVVIGMSAIMLSSGFSEMKSSSQAPSLVQRREMVLIALSTMLPVASNAAQTPGEAIRRSAANIPGYGQPDVYFPSSMLGRWRVNRQIVNSDDVQFANLPMPISVSYDVRFITVDGDNDTKADFKVIADRQYNTASFYNAVRSDNFPTIQSVSWSPFNPNVCTTNYSDGSTVEEKVTKRAVDSDLEAGFISSSEFKRITETSSSSMVPNIKALRVLTKWKVTSDNTVEGIEVVYIDPSIALDPMTARGGGSTKPILSSKSFFKLERISNSAGNETLL
jgi:hypothetical protein